MRQPFQAPDPIDVEVGARIRSTRKSQDISQQDLADAIGLTFQQVQKYERGSNRVSASKLVHIAQALNVGANELLPQSAVKGGSTPSPAVKAALSMGFKTGGPKLLEQLLRLNERDFRLVAQLVNGMDGR